EQDVGRGGAATYFAWWEIIPEPETQVSLPVRAGNTITVTINQTSPGQWVIVIRNVTSGRQVTIKTPYSSTHATAEWIEETPLIIGTNGGFAPLPTLSSPVFDHATVNGAPANLKSSEEIQLIDSNNRVIGAPSAPDPDNDGFNACTWAATGCAPR